ncbi:MAG: hypothetical protein ROO76_11505 [Terriglobia bacterium]|jgi:hypothetical protein|nr:hypothetical protein [Terriglobia bacterium]
MRFAKIVFAAAGIWGFIVLTPLFFLEDKIGLTNPPAITHPEYFYGFICVALAWQVAFLIIAKDPVRFRTLMIACMVEKFPFPIACTLLYMHGRIAPPVLASSMVDLLLGVLFVAAYIRTRREAAIHDGRRGARSVA